MSQPLVLAIEPDLRQAAILKRIVRDKGIADVTVVDSRDAAIEAMRTCMPDVLLLSALLSPRDEDELVAHLKTVENAGHLQTHTIPQLASALDGGEERASRGLLSAFRRKKEPSPVAAGCDPDLFAEEIRVFLQHAAEKKRQQQHSGFTAPDMRPSAVAASQPAAASTEDPAAAGPSSSWSSPFEWKPSGSSSRGKHASERPAAPAPVVQSPVVESPVVETPVAASPAVEAPVAEPASVTTPDPLPVAADAVAAAAVAAEAPLIKPAAVSEVEPPAPSVVVEPIPVPVAAAPAPVVHAAAQIDTTPIPAPAPVPEPVAAAPVAPKTRTAEPARPKPVADRAAKIVERVHLQGLVREQAAKERERIDRLGPLARWARSESPRAAKGAPVTADDVRALITSLAVPASVASVTYPSGCRIRRVRVPVSPDQDSAEGIGPVILSKRTLAEQRDKQTSA